MTFTCTGDEHSGVVTLFWFFFVKEKRRESTNKFHRQECFTLGSSGESHAGNTRPHSFDLTVFSPATPRRQAHLRRAALEISSKVTDLSVISSPSFVISFCCGDTRGSQKGSVRVCVFAISSPPFVSSGSLTSTYSSDLYCSVISDLFSSWSCCC